MRFSSLLPRWQCDVYDIIFSFRFVESCIVCYCHWYGIEQAMMICIDWQLYQLTHWKWMSVYACATTFFLSFFFSSILFSAFTRMHRWILKFKWKKTKTKILIKTIDGMGYYLLINEITKTHIYSTISTIDTTLQQLLQLTQWNVIIYSSLLCTLRCSIWRESDFGLNPFRFDLKWDDENTKVEKATTTKKWRRKKQSVWFVWIDGMKCRLCCECDAATTTTTNIETKCLSMRNSMWPAIQSMLASQLIHIHYTHRENHPRANAYWDAYTSGITSHLFTIQFKSKENSINYSSVLK